MSTDHAGDQDECTTMLCAGDAAYAYLFDREAGQLSRTRNPTHDLHDDGDLHPYVCKQCRERMASNPHWDAERFVRPEEILSTYGGQR